MENNIEFNDFVKTFPHNVFGNLTIIKSRIEDDSYWFVGKEIQNILGFKQLTKAITNADLDEDEFRIVTKKKNPIIFNDFIDHYNPEGCDFKSHPSGDPIVTKFSNTFTLIKESGLYGLAMASRKPVAKNFRRAIRKDILPAIRKMFEVKNDIELKHSILANLNIEYQKLNSIWFNSYSNNDGGVNRIIHNNREITLKHTQKPPSYWKKLGKIKAIELGLPPSKIQSGLDGLRLLIGEESCSISLHKEYIRLGVDEDKAFELSNSHITKAHYKLILDSGIIPKELNK